MLIAVLALVANNCEQTATSEAASTRRAGLSLDLLDGSSLEIGGVADLTLTGHSFELDVPGIGSSRVELVPRSEPITGAFVDQAAVLEREVDKGVRLWPADRSGQPMFMTVDLDGWVAMLHVGNETAPESDLLDAIADQLRGQATDQGVTLSRTAPKRFYTYLLAAGSENQIHVAIGQCVREVVPGAELVEHVSWGRLVSGPQYASWCDGDADAEVMVYGDERFVELAVAGLTVTRNR